MKEDTDLKLEIFSHLDEIEFSKWRWLSSRFNLLRFSLAHDSFRVYRRRTAWGVQRGGPHCSEFFFFKVQDFSFSHSSESLTVEALNELKLHFSMSEHSNRLWFCCFALLSLLTPKIGRDRKYYKTDFWRKKDSVAWWKQGDHLIPRCKGIAM
jgi:hypothetical protein